MGALSGIRVIDVTHHISGPTCTMLLGDYGAEVYKVEPVEGEALRAANVVNTGGQRSTFLAVNRNKHSVCIDLRTDKGRQIVHDMVKASDVFVENFRPGVTDRLHLDYERLAALNPRLVYCSITGFGAAGPLKERPALDLILQAMGGLMSVTGESGGEPLACGAPVADYLSGTHAVMGILLALQARERSGKGQRVEANMLSSMVSLLSLRLQQYWATGEELKPMGSRHPQNTPWGVFCGSDGRRFVLTVNTRSFWTRFCKAVGREDLIDHPHYENNVVRCAHRNALDEELGRLFATQTAAHWLERLVAQGVPCGPVNTLGDVANDEQVRENRILAEVSLADGQTFPVVGPPVRLSDTPGTIRRPSPALGAGTREALQAFGYSEQDLRELADAGVIKI